MGMNWTSLPKPDASSYGTVSQGRYHFLISEKKKLGWHVVHSSVDAESYADAKVHHIEGPFQSRAEAEHAMKDYARITKSEFDYSVALLKKEMENWHPQGVHAPAPHQIDHKDIGQSLAGQHVRSMRWSHQAGKRAASERARESHITVLDELRAMPKPILKSHP